MKNQRDEEKMEAMKKIYEEQDMSPEQVEQLKERIKQAKRSRHRGQRLRMAKQWSAVAAAVLVFIALPNTSPSIAYAMESIPLLGRLVPAVTFRQYQYEDDRNYADIEVPVLVAENADEGVAAAADAVLADIVTTAGTEVGSEVGSELESGAGQGIPATESTTQQLQRSTAEINQEIQEITDQLLAEFEANLDQGYQSMVVDSEILATTEDYFALKLSCYQASGSGAQWDYFYTINLATGKRIQLADLFRDGADYITPISENIKTQMQEQMAADENIAYWLDDPMVPEWNFQQITEDTSFYLNERGNLVISFDEGEVGPMYMGCVEFEIPREVVEDVRKIESR